LKKDLTLQNHSLISRHGSKWCSYLQWTTLRWFLMKSRKIQYCGRNSYRTQMRIFQNHLWLFFLTSHKYCSTKCWSQKRRYLWCSVTLRSLLAVSLWSPSSIVWRKCIKTASTTSLLSWYWLQVMTQWIQSRSSEKKRTKCHTQCLLVKVKERKLNHW
jgi:hypothetical protein